MRIDIAICKDESERRCTQTMSMTKQLQLDQDWNLLAGGNKKNQVRNNVSD